jgi:hypothetical protein
LHFNKNAPTNLSSNVFVYSSLSCYQRPAILPVCQGFLWIQAFRAIKDPQSYLSARVFCGFKPFVLSKTRCPTCLPGFFVDSSLSFYQRPAALPVCQGFLWIQAFRAIKDQLSYLSARVFCGFNLITHWKIRLALTGLISIKVMFIIKTNNNKGLYEKPN